MSGFAITRRDLDHALDFMKDAHGRAISKSKTGENAMGVIGSQVESGFAAFAYGALEGSMGPISVLDVPADAITSVVLHAAGLFGLFGGASGHAHNLAQGLGDGYLHRLGMGIGMKYASKPASAPSAVAKAAGRAGSFVSGTRTRSPMKPMTEAEIAALTSSIR